MRRVRNAAVRCVLAVATCGCGMVAVVAVLDGWPLAPLSVLGAGMVGLAFAIRVLTDQSQRI